MLLHKNTVNFVTRDLDYGVNSFPCTEEKAKHYLSAALHNLTSLGWNTASGEGWFTATNPKSGTSVTCTILH